VNCTVSCFYRAARHQRASQVAFGVAMMSLLAAEPITEIAASRSDERLRTAATRRLGAAGYGELRQIRVTARNGVIELHGCVSSFYLKQVAQTVVLNLEGITQVKNHVRVDG
jgi:osmotically-inducible protein OsmY